MYITSSSNKMEILNSIQPLMFLTMSKNSNNGNNYLLTLLVILLPYISKVFPLHVFYDKIYNYLTTDNDYVSVNIQTHEIPILRGCSSIPLTKLIYSKNFLSVIYFINNNCNIKFNSLTEIMTNNSELMNKWRDEEEKIEKNDYMLMPIENEKILISEKYEIYFELKHIPEKKEHENSKNSNAIIINKKNFIIILSKKKNNSLNSMKIINDFIEECINEYDNLLNITLKDKRQYIFEYKGNENEGDEMKLKFNQYLMEHNKDLNTNIFFEGKDKLIKYINPFVYEEGVKMNIGEEKYKRAGFTFKSGLMFHGYPGCGKTSTIKAILKYTNRHGIIINLSKVKTCQELELLFRNRIINKRELLGKQLCFILEDCDAFENNIIKSRELVNENFNEHMNDLSVKNEVKPLSNIIDFTKYSIINTFKDDDKINLSCFLNILDGIIELHGVMIIMTTNYPEKIDSALIRPGRFDFKHEFKKC